jgi:glycosyltransferase involved in cell wall biosynthesis
VLLSQLFFAKRIVANSLATRDWIGSAWPTLLDRTQVIYNGTFNGQDFDDDGLSEIQNTILIVGRLSERKGQDLMITALAKVRKEIPTATLVLVGDCYPGYEGYVVALHAQAESLFGQKEAVTFAGWSNDVDMWMKRATLVVVPSRVEPFGLVASEAMMHQKAVIAAAVGGLPEIITHGKTGWLIEPENSDALAAACIELLKNQNLRSELGRQAKASSVERFDIERYGSEMTLVFHDLIDGTNRPRG